MATTRFSGAEIPHRIVLTVDVPQRLTTQNIAATVDLAGARLRFLLGQMYQQQVYERAVKRCAAKGAKVAALEAAAQEAEAQEAEALAFERCGVAT
jgi:hypothetical protein